MSTPILRAEDTGTAHISPRWIVESTIYNTQVWTTLTCDRNPNSNSHPDPDGDTESAVKPSYIRAQQFDVGDVVEVNCAGKGVWYRGEVSEAFPDGEYKIKYESDQIKWVTDAAIKGTGEMNR